MSHGRFSLNSAVESQHSSDTHPERSILCSVPVHGHCDGHSATPAHQAHPHHKITSTTNNLRVLDKSGHPGTLKDHGARIASGRSVVVRARRPPHPGRSLAPLRVEHGVQARVAVAPRRSAQTRTVHLAPCTVRRAPCTLRRAPCAVRRAPCTLRRAPCAVRRAGALLLNECKVISNGLAACTGTNRRAANATEVTVQRWAAGGGIALCGASTS